MIKDFGAQLQILSPGGARGVAAGTGDNTKANGAIVDSLDYYGQFISGVLFCVGQATLAEDKVIDINDLYIEHGDESDLSDAAEYTFGSASTDYAAEATGGTGGSTEQFAVKQNVDLTGLKRYWRATVKPDLDATGTDTFELGFGVAAIGTEAPQT